MNVLSLFDGMSCGQIALKELGINVDNYFSSEIDKISIDVTTLNFPNTKHLGDIRQLINIDWNVDKIDLLIGGSPCQSFSRSGDNTGFIGKSGLFYEYLRVLMESNPKYFLLENVVMKKEWENEISKLLGVEPILIDSALVSAQKRQRLYWTNIPNLTIPINKNITTRNISKIDLNSNIEVPNDFLWFYNGEYRVKNATKKGYLVVNNYDVVNLDFPNSKTRRGRVSIQKANTLNTSCNQAIFFEGSLYKLSIDQLRDLQTIPKWYDMSIASDNQIKKMIGNGWTIDIIKHIFSGLCSNL